MKKDFATEDTDTGPLRIEGLQWETATDIVASRWLGQQLGANGAPIRQLAKHGFCLWPDEGADWIHPQDLETATSLLPSKRIFQKTDCLDPVLGQLGYCQFQYGEISFRGLPTLWRELRSDGYEVGDTIELKSDNGRLRPLICDISGMFWSQKLQLIEYSLVRNGLPLPRKYVATDFRMSMKISQSPTFRQFELLAKR